MVQAFRDNVTDWLGRVLAADVYISAEGSAVSDDAIPLPPHLIDQVRQLQPMAHLTTVADVTIITRTGHTNASPQADQTDALQRTTLPWSVTILESDQPIHFPTVYQENIPQKAEEKTARKTNDTWQALSEGAVLISEPLAYERGLSVGDSIIFPTISPAIPSENNDNSVTFASLPIQALLTDFTPDGGRVTMHRQTAQKLGWNKPISGISLRFPETWSADEKAEARDQLAAALVELPVLVQDSQSLRTLSLELFDRTFTITAVLQILTAVVAAAGMVVSGMAHQFERRREWAMLRSMGAEPPQVGRILISGQMVLGIGAGIVAVPFGVLMAWLLAAVVNVRSFGWTLQITVDPWLCLQTIFIAVLTAAVAGWLPARLINKTPMTEAMRWE